MEFVTSLKLDGISVLLTYVNGGFTKAATRGNGWVGEDITKNVWHMNFPKVLSREFTGCIRAEIILAKDNFKRYFPNDSNARNTASGIARAKEKSDLLLYLDVLAYSIYSEQEKFISELEVFSYLDGLGFKTPYVGLGDADYTQFIYNHYVDELREKCPYDIDGLVVTINDRSFHNTLGYYADNTPVYSVAYKFPDEAVVTTIEDIEWSLGDSGRMCPVAKVTPTLMPGGVVLKNVSLHSMKFILENQITIGSRIEVVRSGEVIPYLKRVVERKGELFKSLKHLYKFDYKFPDLAIKGVPDQLEF